MTLAAFGPAQDIAVSRQTSLWPVSFSEALSPSLIPISNYNVIVFAFLVSKSCEEPKSLYIYMYIYIIEFLGSTKTLAGVSPGPSFPASLVQEAMLEGYLLSNKHLCHIGHGDLTFLHTERVSFHVLAVDA